MLSSSSERYEKIIPDVYFIIWCYLTRMLSSGVLSFGAIIYIYIYIYSCIYIYICICICIYIYK